MTLVQVTVHEGNLTLRLMLVGQSFGMKTAAIRTLIAAHSAMHKEWRGVVGEKHVHVKM
jgi:septin family protein